MKLIVETDQKTIDECKKLFSEGYSNDAEYAIATGTPVSTEGDLISRETLKATIIEPLNVNDACKNDWYEGYYTAKNEDVMAIDNAQTVEDHSLEIAKKSIELGRRVGNLEGRIETARTQGDLISREALREDLRSFFPSEVLEGIEPKTLFAQIMHDINNAPTVPQCEWIPVSKRLPDDMQKVLIWFEYFRYGDFNCMYQTCGFGYVCDGQWSPFINDRTGWQDYNIIAWQPLPEPYKKGDAE